MRYDIGDVALGCFGLIVAVVVGGFFLLFAIYIGGSFYSYVISSEDKVCTVQKKENLWSGDDTVMTVTTDCGHMVISESNASIYTYLEEGVTYNMHVTGPPITEITILEAERV